MDTSRRPTTSKGPWSRWPSYARYFADDFQFWMFTPPPFFTPPLSRDELLLTFVHPGIHEKLTPKYYAIDVETLVAVVQFELCFTTQGVRQGVAPAPGQRPLPPAGGRRR